MYRTHFFGGEGERRCGGLAGSRSSNLPLDLAGFRNPPPARISTFAQHERPEDSLRTSTKLPSFSCQRSISFFPRSKEGSRAQLTEPSFLPSSRPSLQVALKRIKKEISSLTKEKATDLGGIDIRPGEKVSCRSKAHRKEGTELITFAPSPSFFPLLSLLLLRSTGLDSMDLLYAWP